MTSKAWKTNIVKRMKEVGTYQTAFDAAIQATADLLEQRDKIYQQYVDEGAQVIVEKVSDRGAKNYAENPLLRTWRELQAQALNYWKELGLTAASLKRINDGALKSGKKLSPLAQALQELNGSS